MASMRTGNRRVYEITGAQLLLTSENKEALEQQKISSFHSSLCCTIFLHRVKSHFLQTGKGENKRQKQYFAHPHNSKTQTTPEKVFPSDIP